MRRRAPWILWRSISADFWRLLLLSAAVLVTVIAFGASIKPISDGLLTAVDLLRFIGYAIPPMLAYALPFAAGFAATIVYHRLAVDHEATAAYAGGISHRTLITPALGAGLVLCLVMALLNELLIPRFLHRMQTIITRDLAAWVVQEINRGNPVNAGGMILTADSATRLTPEPGSGATDLLRLKRFAAIELNSRAEPTTEVTATQGWIWLFPWADPDSGTDGGDGLATPNERPQSRVFMRLENALGVREGGGLAAARDVVDLSWTVTNPFRENPKFLNWRDLRDLPNHPERMSWLDIRRKDLAFCMAERRALSDISEALRTGGRADFLDDQGRRITLSAAGMTPDPALPDTWTLAPLPSGLVQVISEDITVGTALRAQARGGARLVSSIGTDRLNRAFAMRLDLRDATVSEPGGRAATQRPTYTFGGLRPVGTALTDMLSLRTADLLTLARQQTDPPPNAKTALALDDLSRSIRRLENRVLAKIHDRFAFAVATLIITLTGALAALSMSTRLPLTVYMFTFLPAVVAIVTISGGQQATVYFGAPGLILLWSGIVGLMLYAGILWRRLVRH
jgi:lipopolysaccharide export LptBFGC system permease protein LptF